MRDDGFYVLRPVFIRHQNHVVGFHKNQIPHAERDYKFFIFGKYDKLL